MLNRLKPRSEFSRNVLTLMTGSTIAQAIPIAISPILTRVYTPENFGVFRYNKSQTGVKMKFNINYQIINQQKKLKAILEYVTKVINLKVGC